VRLEDSARKGPRCTFPLRGTQAYSGWSPWPCRTRPAAACRSNVLATAERLVCEAAVSDLADGCSRLASAQAGGRVGREHSCGREVHCSAEKAFGIGSCAHVLLYQGLSTLHAFYTPQNTPKNTNAAHTDATLPRTSARRFLLRSSPQQNTKDASLACAAE
jgi:hypothetical protein